MTIDRTQVPSNSWLQFDTKNQEFYGIPLWGDKSFSEYQLVCLILYFFFSCFKLKILYLFCCLDLYR